MSNFTTIYDQLINTTVPALSGFSTKTEIPNPYFLDEITDVNLLRNGWGIRVGESANSEFQEFKYTRVIQSFGFVLSREVKATHNNPAPLQTATKALKEDAVTMRVDFENADQLTIPDNVERIEYIGEDPIEYIDIEDTSIIFSVINFNFEIRESL